MSPRRALELASGPRRRPIRSRSSAPSSSRDGEVVGEGWHERTAAATGGRRARGRRRAGSRRDALRDDGAVRAPRHDAALRRRRSRRRHREGRRRLARPEPGGGGRPRAARAAGVEAELVDSLRGTPAERGLAHLGLAGRPFVTYKVAATLDGRVTVPGARWVSGEESRRLVHELRAASDAVAVGMGTVRAEHPRLDARDVARRAAAAPARVRPRARSPRARSSSCARARSRRSSRRSRRRASSRCCSRAARRSRRRSSRPSWSTSCCSSSRRRSRATGRGLLGDLHVSRWSCSTLTRGRSARTSCSRRTLARAVSARARSLDACSRASCERSDGRRRRRRRRGPCASRSRLRRPPPRVELGGSVAIDGVCLTVVAVDGDRTRLPRRARRRSALDSVSSQPASRVNVEPALRAGDPLGGHYVQGHVDGIGSVARVEPEGEGVRIVDRGAGRARSATASRRARSPSRASR